VFAIADTKGIRVPIRVRRYLHRILITAALGLGIFPTICRAQESNLPAHTLTQLVGTMPAPSLSAAGDIVAPDERTGQRHASTSPVIETASSRLGVFLPLYASFAGLQALDAHSTVRALQAGGSERNPLLREIAGRPAALFALKAGVTASTILLTEKLRVKNRVGAIVLMAALDSVYAMVVVHNYRAIP
jgi:hypothetical protein